MRFNFRMWIPVFVYVRNIYMNRWKQIEWLREKTRNSLQPFCKSKGVCSKGV